MTLHGTVVFNEANYTTLLEQERFTALEQIARMKMARGLGGNKALCDADIAIAQARYNALTAGSAVDHYVAITEFRNMFVPTLIPEPGFETTFLAGVKFQSTESGTSAWASGTSSLAATGNDTTGIGAWASGPSTFAATGTDTGP